MLTFNLTSYRSGSVLVEAARLMVSLENISPQSRVRVSQVVEEGEISLDIVRTGEAGTPSDTTLTTLTTLQLDVSHAVSGWLAQPHTNLGLRLSLESRESRERLEVKRAEVVLETREILVRQRREAGAARLVEFQPDLVNSRTDCRRADGKKNKCCR